MPKYSQVRAKDLVKLLEKYWFVRYTQAGSHLTMKNFKTGRRVVIPIHPKPLWKWLLNAILKQAGLSKDVLKDL
jgi:predicted RNA binding protein YcfA (HicA-like mRNA interferase family)